MTRGAHFVDASATPRRRRVLALASSLLFIAGVAASIGGMPKAVAVVQQSPGCEELNLATYDGSYTEKNTGSKLFWKNDVVRASYTGAAAPVASGDGQYIYLGPALTPTNWVGFTGEAAGSLQYVFDNETTTELGIIAKPGPATWDVRCVSNPGDFCAAMNDASFDGAYLTKTLPGTYLMTPFDATTVRVTGTGVTTLTASDVATSTVVVGTSPIQTTLGISIPFAVTDFTLSANVPGTWTVTCNRVTSQACLPGAPIPAGYKLVTGTGGDDNIYGGSGNQLYRLGEGNDTVNDLSGNDIMCGEGGSDSLNGGTGNDVLIGGEGTDTLNGGGGTDYDCGTGDTRISIEVLKCTTYVPPAPLL